MSWTVPKTDQLLAAFYLREDGLDAVERHDEFAEYAKRAADTAALWGVLNAMQDASLMIVKSERETSLAMAAGGLIVEGRKNLNIGLIRASAKALDPVVLPSKEEIDFSSEGDFHQTFWQVFRRLSGTVLTRLFIFDIGGKKFEVRVEDGYLHFADASEDPESFVAALRHASQAKSAVQYSLGDAQATFTGRSYPLSMLMAAVAEVTEGTQLELDPKGWPLSCGADLPMKTVPMLSRAARAFSDIYDSRGAVSISVLSLANKPVLKGSSTPDGSVLFDLP